MYSIRLGMINTGEVEMKRILATSAIAMMLSAPAFAGSHGGMFMKKAENIQVLGSEFIGSYVYVSETEFDEDYVYEDGAEQEWDNIGDINEIVLSRDGTVDAVVVGVGGFLGMGEKDVAVKMDSLRFVSDGEDADEYFVVFTSSKAALEGAPEWQDDDRRERMMEAREERAAMRAEADRDRYRADTMALNSLEREGYAMVKASDMRASDLIGTRVYGTKDEDVGEVSDIIVNRDKNIREALVDVGGFLGMGEKTVAMPMDDLRIMQAADDDDDLRVYVDATQERLENMRAYEQ